MNIPDGLGAALVGLGAAVGLYLQSRRMLTARANLRALRARGFRTSRLLPWRPLSKFVWRFDDESAIVLEHDDGFSDDIAFTRVGFFGSRCVPTATWANAAEFSELAGFAIRRGGFLVTLESRSDDAMAASRAFPALVETWSADFSAVMRRCASLPADLACGACGRLTDDDAPERRARCGCGAVYHLKCAEWLGGECTRRDCPSRAGSDEPTRLVTILRASLPSLS